MRNIRIILFAFFITFAIAETHKSYYPDGKIKSAATYKDGIKSGVEHIYYPDGATLMYAKNYLHGKLHGLQQKYDKSALLIQEENYTHGKLDGKSRYYHNGLLVSEIEYRRGLPDGEYKEFYPSGVMRLRIIWRRGKAIEGYRYGEDGSTSPVENKTLQALTAKAQMQADE